MFMLKKSWLVAIIDAALVNLCIVSVFSVRFLGSVPQRNLLAYKHTFIYLTVAFAVLFYIQGLYDNDENDDGVAIIFKVIPAVTSGAITLMALTFISRAFAFPRTVIAISYLVMLVLFIMWHLFVHQRFLLSLPVKKFVVYGGEERIEHLKKCIEDEGRRFEFLGEVPELTPDALEEMLASGRADSVIIADDVSQSHELAFDLFLKYPNVSFFLLPQVADIIVGARHQTVIGDAPLIALGRRATVSRFFLIKRSMDIFTALVGLVCLSPFLLLVAIAIKLTSRGPVFYSQPRVGFHGRPFQILKLRTMIKNAEEPTGPMLATDNDPRVIPVGRILRRLKIDEIPQLINVLRGEMSLVGPRPERPEFVAQFEEAYPAYTHRKQVLPGITGLAQVNGRYETDPSLKLKYDLIYIYNYKPRMDVAILYQTFQYIMRSNL
jgi:exopolysaccharide biosynthesis polyprenyl glycosylphosphotransferase